MATKSRKLNKRKSAKTELIDIYSKNIAKNVILNLISLAIPLLIGVITVPFLLKILGVERLGLLSIVWVVTGYFNIFDIGIARALTKLTAERLGTNRESEVQSLITTGFLLITVLGIVGGSILWAITPWIINSLLNIPYPLIEESTSAFKWLALSIPFVMISTGMLGVLQAYQRFDLVALSRLFTGAWMFVGPLIVSQVTISLGAVVSILVIGRVINWFFVKQILHRTIGRCEKYCIKRTDLFQLVTFGGWVSVSSIIGPVMVYFDRFFISSIIGIAIVTYYTIPYDFITRLWLIPRALTGVLFPVFSNILITHRKKASCILQSNTKYVFIVMYPVTFLIIMFSKEGLSLWLGQSFADQSAPVLQWLTFGILINSMAQLAFSVIQADGRPDITAKLHIIELPIYFILLWFLIRTDGIEGAAKAWVARVVIDTTLLYIIATKRLSGRMPEFKGIVIIGLLAMLPLVTVVIVENLVYKIFISSITIAIFLTMTWKNIMTETEKISILRGIGKVRNTVLR